MTRNTLIKKLTQELIIELRHDPNYIYNELTIANKIDQAMTIGSERYPVYKKSRHNAKPVIQLTKEGKYKNRFPSASDAARAFGHTEPSGVVRSCNDPKGKSKFKGYLWRYET